jgi:hypothetical protein
MIGTSDRMHEPVHQTVSLAMTHVRQRWSCRRHD